MSPKGNAVPRPVPVLLTFTAGALDVTAFLALGHVFASVMTGNLVLLGLAGARWDAGLAIAAGLAFLGYSGGAMAGARMSEVVGRGAHGGRAALAVLGLELVTLLAFGIAWLATATVALAPVHRALLTLAAIAMGLQSSAVKAMGTSGLSTTYLTGTLTRLLVALARRHGERSDPWDAVRLVALVAGAVMTGLVLRVSPRLVPVVPWCTFAAAYGLALRGRDRTGPAERARRTPR